MKAIRNNLHFYYILIFKGNRDVQINKSETEDISLSFIDRSKEKEMGNILSW